MRKSNILVSALAAVAVLAAGCSKSNTESQKDDLRDFFLAWMAENQPGATPTKEGIYILEETSGYGLAYDNTAYAQIDITISDIEGNVSSTTNEKMAKQLGTYNKTYYYGPRMTAAGDNVSAALHYVLSGMRKGGRRKVIAPFWLNTYSRYDTQEEYYRKSGTDASNIMYDIYLKDFTNDVDRWEIDSLETDLVKLYQNAPDSLSYGLYYHQLAPPADEEAFPNDTIVYINYTGRLLNGQVFDTTIKDTAIVYGIYSSSKSYKPQKLAWAANAESLKLEGSSVIAGFYNTLWHMHKYEKGIGYFISRHGYSSTGSGNMIPPYSPLSFEIEIVDAP